ncbi:hypothetical protein CRE_16218 [Caenorhabditis remanei]|uniref:Uncharacterized protein n=1 Tax=Caenorhabditis remanei TaxID=31234 RepID=E3MSM5_CAERE|nr:hypothetical protein CRE_16218 [Caenorhabditis remanei]
MKTSLMILLVLSVIHVTSTAAATSSASMRRFIVKNDVFMGRRVPDFCMEYFESSSAKLKLDNINRELIADALESQFDWKLQEEYARLQMRIQDLAEKQYADHICDAAEFSPTILSADYQYTCTEWSRPSVPVHLRPSESCGERRLLASS